MLVPEPLAIAVKRHHEQVVQVQVAQGFTPPLGLHDGVAELWTHAFQNRCAQQEGLNACGQALQHLFEQVVLHQAMAAGERPDERIGVALPGQRHGRHVHASGPTFGARVQCLNLGFGQPQRHRLVQKQRALLGYETQVLRAQVEHLALSAQPRQRDGRRFPRHDHQMQLRGQVVDEESQQRVNLRAAGELVVIENKHQPAAPLGQSVHQMDQHRFCRWPGSGLGHRQCTVAQIGGD